MGLEHGKKLDGVGPVDNRPSTDYLRNFFQYFLQCKKMGLFFIYFKFFDKVVELVGGGTVINRAYPSSYESTITHNFL